MCEDPEHFTTLWWNHQTGWVPVRVSELRPKFLEVTERVVR